MIRYTYLFSPIHVHAYIHKTSVSPSPYNHTHLSLPPTASCTSILYRHQPRHKFADGSPKFVFPVVMTTPRVFCQEPCGCQATSFPAISCCGFSSARLFRLGRVGLFNKGRRLFACRSIHEHGHEHRLFHARDIHVGQAGWMEAYCRVFLPTPRLFLMSSGARASFEYARHINRYYVRYNVITEWL